MKVEMDSYTRRARIAPLLVVIAPAVLALIAWFPEASRIELGAATVVLAIALPTVFAQCGGVLGKRREKELFGSWGGPPTTQRLRHRTRTQNPVLRSRYHAKLQELLPDLSIPKEVEENYDQRGADNVYETCVKHLIAMTRDQKLFALVFAENVSYGFRRNLWAMKSLGLAVASGGLLACGIRMWSAIASSTAMPTSALLGALLSLVWLALWLSLVSADWVRERADAYADRLLEAMETLTPPAEKSSE